MGFGIQQPLYQRHGLATFPVLLTPDKDKQPAVRNWQRIGFQASAQLASRQRHEDALVGLSMGRKTGLTFLDVDEASEDLLRDCLKTHGDTPILSRTASGKFHAWYRHNGERRQIRPFKGLEVDVLGGGFAVVPDSETDKGRYEFIRGSLEDLDRLPIMKGLDLAPPILKGSRDTELFAALRAYAVSQGFDVNEEELMFYASSWNERCDPPMTDAEMQKPVRGVLKLIAEGRCWTNQQQSPRIPMAIVDALSPDAWWMLTKLKAAHWDRKAFALTKAYAEALGWTLKRFYAVRDELTAAKQIRCVHKGGRGPKDPPVYKFSDE